MSDIQVGDEVSWNWGGGQPTGVAKETKTTGKLEIESNGKLVHKNADENNPGVHIEREGNDVAKRASELEKLRGGGEQDNAKAGDEAAVPEGGEPEEPKKTTRSGRRGGRKSTAETRKKQSEAGKKGGAATAVKKAGGRKRGKAAPEDAAVGEKREREGVVEEKGEKEGEDINMKKDRVQVTSVTAEQEKAEKEAGKKAKKAKVSPERPDDEYVPGEEAEEEAAHKEAKPVKATGPTAGISEELKGLERDNRNLGLDVGAVGAEPRRAAEATPEDISVTASVEAGSTGVLERMEAAAAGEEGPSPTGEKKRGGRKGARGKAAA